MAAATTVVGSDPAGPPNDPYLWLRGLSAVRGQLVIAKALRAAETDTQVPAR
jgi:hypothetical protein